MDRIAKCSLDLETPRAAGLFRLLGETGGCAEANQVGLQAVDVRW